jgi:hypothetical protein
MPTFTNPAGLSPGIAGSSQPTRLERFEIHLNERYSYCTRCGHRLQTD